MYMCHFAILAILGFSHHHHGGQQRRPYNTLSALYDPSSSTFHEAGSPSRLHSRCTLHVVFTVHAHTREQLMSRCTLHLVFMARTSSPQHALSPHNNTRSSQHGRTRTHEMEESDTQESLMDNNLARRRGYSSTDGDSIANSTLDSSSTPSIPVKSAITPSFS